MFRSLLFILSLSFGSLALGSTTTNNILVLGDSISAAYGINTDSGWVSLLSLKIAQKKKPYQVINASISGDTTINGLKRLPALLKKYEPAIVIIELGGNDGLRGLSLKTIENNLKQIIELSQKSGAKTILAGMKIPPNYGRRYTRTFYKIYNDLSKNHQTGFIPFLLEGIGDKKELMQKDGLHPAQGAQKMIMEIVWEKLVLIL